MAQPLTRVKPDARIQTHWSCMAHRPELALLVVQILAAWSHTENTLGRVLAACLHADSSAGVAMYLSLSGGEARRSALEAAASNSLDDHTLEIFRLTMKSIKPVRERRNQLAHGLWGMSPDLPDALLLQSPNEDVIHYDRMMKNAPSPGRKIMVYRKKDLEADLDDAEQATSAVTRLWFLCSPNGEDQAGHSSHLLNLPLIAKHRP